MLLGRFWLPLNSPLLLLRVCNFCNSSIDFVAQNDTRKPPLFKFAANQNDAARRLVQSLGIASEKSYLDSVILLRADGQVFEESDAVLHIARGLRFPFPILAAAGFIIPGFIRDPLYRWMGRNRYSIFGKRDTCRLPTPDERERFIL
jgi:predicted DCC family thiol-disulfide oxidoreductase YuxK